MSKSIAKNPVRSMGIKQYKVPFEFTTNNTSDPSASTVYGKGVSSVAYNAATGQFLVTLTDTFGRLAAFTAVAIGTTYYKVNLRAVSNEGSSTTAITAVLVVLDDAFAAADTTGVRIVGEFTFEDSDA